MRLVIAVLLVLATAGCGVYLHSPQNQATADAALKDFQSFREKSGNPYAVMLKNLEKAKAATADAQRAAAERRVTGFALGLPYKTWGELDADLEAEQKRLIKEESTLNADIAALSTDLGQAEQAGTGAGAKLALMKKAVAAQFNQNQRWVAQQALFKHAIQKIAEQSTAPKSDLGVNDIAGAVNELLDVQVTVQRQKDDGQIEVVDRKIRDVLGAALPTEWTGVPDFVKKLSGVALDPASSPGIAITILGLAVDLADAEYRTAQVRVAMLKQRADILDALARNIAQSKRLLGMAREDFRAVTVGQPILTNLEELRKPATPPPAGDPAQEPSVRLGAGLRILARAAIPTTLLASERLQRRVELATLDHEYSIGVSAINAQAHEALIGRGLEGLATYHRGGVTPEEIANFIRAAQAVALGVIGARL